MTKYKNKYNIFVILIFNNYMKFSNSTKALSLWLVLTLSPLVSNAKDDVESNIKSIIETEITQANTIDLSKAIYLHWKISKINEWEQVYVLYQTQTKTWKRAWILLLWIPYNKKEMWSFQPAIIWWANWPFKFLLAPEWKVIPWTDNFSVVNIK